MTPEYLAFLAGKAPRPMAVGIEPAPMPAHLFDYQAAATAFCIRQGRAALFLDTGLGKTVCELEFARQTAAASNGWALILTPLAVARQIETEGRRFGYDCRVIRSMEDAGPGINICNYDRLDKLDCSAFGVVVLDESSILKNFSGATTRSLIALFADTPYRLCATATPAPNDHIELGTHSEFLGIMPQGDMLVRWFINNTADTGNWRLKGHARRHFWDWMASWAVMASSPEDLGFDGARFVLPPMNVIRHKAIGEVKPMDGMLFVGDVSATNMHAVKRLTADARADLAVSTILSLSGEEGTWIQESDGQQKKMPSIRNAEMTTKTQPLDTANRSLKAGKTPKSTQQGSLNKDSATLSGSNCKTIGPYSTSKMHPAAYAGLENHSEMADGTSIIATPPTGSEGFSAITVISGSDHSKTIPKTSEEPRGISKVTRMPAWVLWCDTNEEQSILEKKLGTLAISITGSMTPEKKEALHEAWLRGDAPVMLTKSSIFGQGVNWQMCSNVIFVGRSFSYESWYQAVRRCWRFGQKRPVDVHLIVAEGEDQIGRVLERKAGAHFDMKMEMIAASKRGLGRSMGLKIAYQPKHEGRLPAWLSSAA